jgi:hypothetical protein
MYFYLQAMELTFPVFGYCSPESEEAVGVGWDGSRSGSEGVEVEPGSGMTPLSLILSLMAYVLYTFVLDCLGCCTFDLEQIRTHTTSNSNQSLTSP